MIITLWNLATNWPFSNNYNTSIIYRCWLWQ